MLRGVYPEAFEGRSMTSGCLVALRHSLFREKAKMRPKSYCPLSSFGNSANSLSCSLPSLSFTSISIFFSTSLSF